MGTGAENRAERKADRASEVAFFLGDADAALFGVIHLPHSPTGHGVLVCQSILIDFVPNYRREVVVARHLAANGVATARFHYRGFGHSSGTPLDATFESMCADTHRMIEHFVEVADADRIGFLGTRWGAMVAAAVAQDIPGSPLALWEPTLTSRDYFKEAFRAQRMSQVASSSAAAGGPEEIINRDGHIDILGYPLGKALWESSGGLDLVELLHGTTGPVLFVGGAGVGGLKKRDRAAVDKLRDAGLVVDVDTTQGPDAWWFIDEENATPVETALDTARWLAERLGDIA